MNNACLDSYDERNYPYEEMVGDTSNIPDFVFYNPEIQDQYRAGYPMGCVYFNSSMHDNFLNKRDGIDEKTSGAELCDISDTRSPTQGDYNINGPKLLKKLGHIKGYAQVITTQGLLHAIANIGPLHLGSNRIVYAKTRLGDYYAVFGIGTGHSFGGYGYNLTKEYREMYGRRVPPECLIIVDSSFGFNAGCFYIPLKDLEAILYPTRLTFINNTDLIDNYKKMVLKEMKLDSAKLFFLLGLTNGERPQENITREEVMSMNYRVIEKLVSGELTQSKIEEAKKELMRLNKE